MKTAIGAAGIAAVSVFTAAKATANPNIQRFGTPEQLVDGPMVTAYTARADNGTVTPLVSDFNARASNGQTYRVIDTVATPDGISPAPTVQGGRSSGKIYFDVTGAQPDGVGYDDGVQDVLVWTT